MSTFLVIMLSAYLLFLLIIIWGWRKVKALPIRWIIPTLQYSVVVPFRNEAKNLSALLTSFENLDFPRKNFEIVLVNDHSDDDFHTAIESFLGGDLTIRLEKLNDKKEGKKVALQHGIAVAKGDVIVTTDADCQVPVNWLNSYTYYFEKLAAKIAFGGVMFRTKTFFEKLQQVEFASLIGSGASTLSLGLPSMCNGANLAFRKDTYYMVGGYSDNIHIPSGDDEFLMHKIYKLDSKGVFFIKGEDAVVTTQALDSIKAFFYQRKRWAGKWKHYTSFKNSVLAIMVFLFQFSIALTIGYLLIGSYNPWVLGLLFTKVVLEGYFLYRVNKNLGNKLFILPFIILQITYPVYVVLFGLTANFGSYSWKGRKHKL